jgi:hypothetical protein
VVTRAPIPFMQSVLDDDISMTAAEGQTQDVARASSQSQKQLPLQAVVDEAALEIAKASLIGACEYFPWAGPLLESAALRPTTGAVFVTCWGGTSTGVEPYPDAQKHHAYVAHMERTIREACPWLLPLLECAGATVIVSPGVFCFMVPHRYGTAHGIPPLQALTYLLPWVEPGEAIQ